MGTIAGQPATPEPGSSSPERLESWKEIAAYLKRDVRTVQRWESSEGLPIHRLPHARQGTVFAFKNELDSWWSNRAEQSSQQESPLPERVQPEFAAPSKRLTRRMAFAAIAFILILAAVFLAWRQPAARADLPLLALRQDENGLIAQSSGGSVAWTFSFSPQLGRLFGSRSTLEGPHGGGHGEVLASFRSVSDYEHNSDFIMCFSNTGKLMWRFEPADTLKFQKSSYGPVWRIRSAVPMNINGQTRIVVSLLGANWWPSEVLLLDLQGKLLDHFVSSGWMYQIEPFQTPTGPVLLARGFSNSRSSWFLAVLDPSRLSGSTPEEPGTEFQCTNCPQGHPLKYFVFPPSELSKLLGPRFNEIGETIWVGNSFGVVVGEAVHHENLAESYYEFTSDVEPKSAKFDETYWSMHIQLEDENVLKHSKAQCPDRNGPTSVQRWTPQEGWKTIPLNFSPH